MRNFLIGLLFIPVAAEAQLSANNISLNLETPKSLIISLQTTDSVALTLTWDYTFRGAERLDVYDVDLRGADNMSPALDEGFPSASGRFGVFSQRITSVDTAASTISITAMAPRPTAGDTLYYRGRVRAVDGLEEGPWGYSSILVITEEALIPPPSGIQLDTINLAFAESLSQEAMILVSLPDTITQDLLFRGINVTQPVEGSAFRFVSGQAKLLCTYVFQGIPASTGNDTSDYFPWRSWMEQVEYELRDPTGEFYLLPYRAPVVMYENEVPVDVQNARIKGEAGCMEVGRCTSFSPNPHPDWNNMLCDQRVNS